MSDVKKARWPLSERAADLEAGAGWQGTQGRALDNRKQSDKLPLSSLPKKLKGKRK